MDELTRIDCEWCPARQHEVVIGGDGPRCEECVVGVLLDIPPVPRPVEHGGDPGRRVTPATRHNQGAGLPVIKS